MAGIMVGIATCHLNWNRPIFVLPDRFINNQAALVGSEPFKNVSFSFPACSNVGQMTALQGEPGLGKAKHCHPEDNMVTATFVYKGLKKSPQPSSNPGFL